MEENEVFNQNYTAKPYNFTFGKAKYFILHAPLGALH